MARLAALKPRLSAQPSRLKVVDHTVERQRQDASPWRAWYKTVRWQRLRWACLVRDLFTCQWPGCGRAEADTSQLVADHKRPHRGDPALFWDAGNLQCLCKPHHDSAKQREERRL